VILPFVYEPMPLAHIGAVALVSLLGFLAMFCITRAFKEASAGVVAPMQYSQIIWAGIFGTAFFSQDMSLTFIVGALLIVSSGLYIVQREWTKVGSLQPVLSTGTFRPDSGLRPRFLLSKLFRRY